tara:strand:- start:195 stop:785 length:591 start_codon:yes stop_codon:yes gene_type:complete
MSPLSFGIGKSRGTVFDPAVFYCNFLIFNWNWTDGKDFDIIAEFIEPNISGQVGARKGTKIQNADQSVTYMDWGGDNILDTDNGYESILIDVPAIQSAPGNNSSRIVLDLRGTWYDQVGLDPIIITADGFQGGTPLKEGETGNIPGFGFYNPTAIRTFENYKQSFGTQIITTNRENSGQRITRVEIDTSTFNMRYF